MSKPNLARIFIFFLLSLLLIFLSVYEDWLEETFLTLILVTVASGSLLLALIRQSFRRVRSLELAVLFLILVFFLSTVESRVHFWSLLAVLRWLALLEIFYLIFGLLEKREVEKAVRVILLAATISAIWGLVEFLNSENPIEIRRLYGALHTHVWTAGYFLLVTPLPFIKFLYESSKVKKVLWGALLGLFLLILVLTYARGAWLSFLPIILLLLFVSRRALWKNKITLALIFGLVFALVLFISSPALLLGRAKSLFFFYNPQKAASVQRGIVYDMGLTHRTSNYKNALKIAKDYPLLGVGLSNFGWVYHQYQNQPWIYSRYAHSSYFDILTETGLIGFFSFILFAGVCFYLVKGKLREVLSDPQENVLALGLLGGVSASFLHNFIESDWHITVILMLFIMELALLVVLLRKEETEIKVSFNSQAKVFVGGAAVVSILFALALRMSIYNYQAYLRASSRGDLARSYGYAWHSVEWAPFFPFAYEALGDLFLKQGKLEEALFNFKKASSLNPLYSENSFNIGFVQSQLGLDNEAEENFKEAIKRGPYTTPRYYNALAQFYLLKDEKDKAKETYEASISHFPYNPVFAGYAYMYNLMKKHILESYFSLAMIYLDEGDKQRARELLGDALKFDPKNVGISEAMETIE